MGPAHNDADRRRPTPKRNSATVRFAQTWSAQTRSEPPKWPTFPSLSLLLLLLVLLHLSHLILPHRLSQPLLLRLPLPLSTLKRPSSPLPSAPASSSSSGSKRPRSQHYISVADGICGIMISCDVHKEKRAVAESLNLLNQITDELYGAVGAGNAGNANTNANANANTNGSSSSSTSASTSASTPSDILGELASELAAARGPAAGAGAGTGAGNRWCVVQTGVRGLLLLAVRPGAGAVDTAAVALAACGRGGSRCLQRLVPLAATAPARPDRLAAAVAAAVRGALGPAAAPASYAVELRSRHSEALPRAAVLEAVRGAVAPAHAVALDAPQYVVLVEVWGGLCGVGLVPGALYRRYRRLNLQQIAIERQHAGAATDATDATDEDANNKTAGAGAQG